MSELQTVTNETPKQDQYNDLLKQIDEFATLEDWWNEKILWPTLRKFAPQFVALLIVESLIIYSHNWLAAFLCAVIMISRAYQTLTMMSVSMIHAYLIWQIRDSFIRGKQIGESKIQNTTT